MPSSAVSDSVTQEQHLGETIFTVHYLRKLWHLEILKTNSGFTLDNLHLFIMSSYKNNIMGI